MQFIKVKFPKLEIDPSKLASRVCSDHFTASEFERDLKNEMLGLPVKKLLKHDAVPQKLQAKKQEEHRKQLVEDILAQDPDSRNNIIYFEGETVSEQVIHTSPHYSETFVNELRLKIEQQDKMIAEAEKTSYQLLTQIIELKKQVIASNEERDKCRDQFWKMRTLHNNLKKSNELLRKRTEEPASSSKG
jgi:hypothetical protein